MHIGPLIHTYAKSNNLVAIVTEWYSYKKLAPTTLTGRTQTRRQKDRQADRDRHADTRQTRYTITSLKRGIILRCVHVCYFV